MQNYSNTGNHNTGYHNSGDWNTGNRNTGDCNTGYRNTGYSNTGDWNTGNHNTSNRNTGNRNTGNWNTGNRNTGNWNTGDWNSCNHSAGFFNTVEQPLYIFNKIVEGVTRSDIDTYFQIKLTEWVLPENMTNEEKKENPSWETCEGYLKQREFKEACVLAWSEADPETKDKFLNLPNFDSKIFFEITGIDVKIKEETINIDNVEYTLSEIKKALKKQ
jgi:hypothetical protein